MNESVQQFCNFVQLCSISFYKLNIGYEVSKRNNVFNQILGSMPLQKPYL